MPPTSASFTGRVALACSIARGAPQTTSERAAAIATLLARDMCLFTPSRWRAKGRRSAPRKSNIYPLLSHAKRQEHVAADAAAEIRVTRRDEQHAAGDDWPCGVDHAPLRLYAVDGVEASRGVVLPDGAAVGGRVCVDHAGRGAEKYDAGNHRDRSAATFRRGRSPHHLAAR